VRPKVLFQRKPRVAKLSTITARYCSGVVTLPRRFVVKFLRFQEAFVEFVNGNYLSLGGGVGLNKSENSLGASE
jgi:hypothetical protein